MYTQVCNHPDLFEPRPTLSPFRMTAIRYYTASLVLHAMQYDPFKVSTLHVVEKTFVNLIWMLILARDAHCVHVRFPLKFASTSFVRLYGLSFFQTPHLHTPNPPYISSSPPKHVCLGHLNLRLPDTEFTVEAFAAFRCSQLQAPRAYLLDPLSAHPHGVDLTGERGGLLAGGDEGELSDLFLVRSLVLCMLGVNES